MIASMYVYLVDFPTADAGHFRIGCVHGIVNVDVISSDGGAYISMDEPFYYNNEKKKVRP